jgi:hypothetical protein
VIKVTTIDEAEAQKIKNSEQVAFHVKKRNAVLIVNA